MLTGDYGTAACNRCTLLKLAPMNTACFLQTLTTRHCAALDVVRRGRSGTKNSTAIEWCHATRRRSVGVDPCSITPFLIVKRVNL
jgi:hypothetical protein